MPATNFEEWMETITYQCKHVVSWNDRTDRLVRMDFSKENNRWNDEVTRDEHLFKEKVERFLLQEQAIYGIGGYNELRAIYAVSEVFGKHAEEPRRLHIGMDIWGRAGTTVFAPLKGSIHSFAFNNRYGDYGATIILKHVFTSCTFYTLYGHLCLNDLAGIQEGDVIESGQAFAHFGDLCENGHWPPHLHFQIIKDMQGMKGDYPGVCKQSEAAFYLKNCPNPDLILQMMPFAIIAK